MIDEIPSSTKEFWEGGKMPLTESGKKVMENMKDEYGDEEGERVFYASRNKGKPGSEKWESERLRKSHGARKGRTRKAMRNMRRNGYNKNVHHQGASED